MGDRLEKSLTEIDAQDASIDTFSDFPNRHTVKYQLICRQLGLELGLLHYQLKADTFAEIMRSFHRMSRGESKEALIGEQKHEEKTVGMVADILNRGKVE